MTKHVIQSCIGAAYLSLAMSLSGFAEAQSTSCPVTLPESSLVEVPGLPSDERRSWYGSSALAVLLPIDGTWSGMGPEHHYRDKLWWWRHGFDPDKEPTPDLVLEATRLDGDAPVVRIEGASSNSGDGEDWSAMLLALEFPASGCWQVNARYRQERLSFIVRVGVAGS